MFAIGRSVRRFFLPFNPSLKLHRYVRYGTTPQLDKLLKLQTTQTCSEHDHNRNIGNQIMCKWLQDGAAELTIIGILETRSVRRFFLPTATAFPAGSSPTSWTLTVVTDLCRYRDWDVPCLSSCSVESVVVSADRRERWEGSRDGRRAGLGGSFAPPWFI
jgi:hypothetical protein